MYLENYFIELNDELNIYSISNYRNIIINFINNYINKKEEEYKNKNELYNDAHIYSKYYLYYKIMNCKYSENIMNIIYDIEYN